MGFDAAKNEAPGLIVKFDVRSSRDCTNGDCANSDKLPVDSEAACAKACGQVVACTWWSVGIEDGDKMCWLRSSDKGLRPMVGSSAGRQTCQPVEDGSLSLWWIGLCVVALLPQRNLGPHPGSHHCAVVRSTWPNQSGPFVN